MLDQAISNLKASGGLVEVEIERGRFRRGRGLSVDWGKTAWAAEHTEEPAESDDESSRTTAAEAEEAPALPEDRVVSVLVNWSMDWSMIGQLVPAGSGG